MDLHLRVLCSLCMHLLAVGVLVALREMEKTKPFELMKETEEFVHSLKLLGCNWIQTEDLFQRLEKFVCCIFGQRNVSSVNSACFSISQTTGKFVSTYYHLAMVTPNKSKLPGYYSATMSPRQY